MRGGSYGWGVDVLLGIGFWVCVAVWLVGRLRMPRRAERRRLVRERVEQVSGGEPVLAEQVGWEWGSDEEPGCDWLRVVTPRQMVFCSRPRLRAPAEDEWTLEVQSLDAAQFAVGRHRSGYELYIDGHGGWPVDVILAACRSRLVDPSRLLAAAGYAAGAGGAGCALHGRRPTYHSAPALVATSRSGIVCATNFGVELVAWSDAPSVSVSDALYPDVTVTWATGSFTVECVVLGDVAAFRDAVAANTTGLAPPSGFDSTCPATTRSAGATPTAAS